jgi:hypothetical protein
MNTAPQIDPGQSIRANCLVCFVGRDCCSPDLDLNMTPILDGAGAGPLNAVSRDL